MTLCGSHRSCEMGLGHMLGSGGQGTVFKMTNGPADCQWYIKCHKQVRHFDTEVETLMALAGVPGVVQLKAVDEQNLAFAASPICRKISRFRGKVSIFNMAVEMLETLEAVHQQGYGHRDARCGNFFVEVDAERAPVRAVIGDWATAVKLGRTVAYEGTVHFAADSVLRNLQARKRTFRYTAAMDLESLAKTVWDLLQDTPCGVEQLSSTYYGDILTWWTKRAANDELLASYLECARESNYHGLKSQWSLVMRANLWKVLSA